MIVSFQKIQSNPVQKLTPHNIINRRPSMFFFLKDIPDILLFCGAFWKIKHYAGIIRMTRYIVCVQNLGDNYIRIFSGI